QGVDALGQLDLENHKLVAAERDFGAGQIELPHAAETLVVKLGDRIPLRLEAPPPLLKRLGVVQAQNLHVGYNQSRAPDDTEHFTQRRGVTAGENVFGDPGICHAGAVAASDGVQQRDSVVL